MPPVLYRAPASQHPDDYDSRSGTRWPVTHPQDWCGRAEAAEPVTASTDRSI